jgi:hypothetical protein
MRAKQSATSACNKGALPNGQGRKTTGGHLGRIDRQDRGGTVANTSELLWQPIASAPHNEEILVHSRRWGVMIAAFRPEFNAWFSRMQCPAALNEDDADLITHWMPLPARPQMSERVPLAPRAPATGLPPSLARFLDRVSSRQAA